jgi:hypothetical protein
MRNVQGSIRALLLAVIASAALCLAAGTAAAQPLLWNPPCPNARIFNCTPCTAVLTLWTNPAVPAVIVPAFGMVVAPMAPAPLFVNGVISQGGAFVPLVQPPPVIVPPPLVPPCVAPAPGPMNGVVRSVTLGPAPGCCFDVYFNTTSDPAYPCTIFLYPAPQPCRNP